MTVRADKCVRREQRTGMSRGLVSLIQHLILSIQPMWYGLESMALRIKYSKCSLKVVDRFLEQQ